MARSLKEMLGKQVLACLTEIDANGRIIRRQEFHGPLSEEQGKPQLRAANRRRPFALPEDPEFYFPADPELEYQLCESGELIRGIDYTLTFIKAPPEYFQQTEGGADS
jgi:hypothetical protein